MIDLHVHLLGHMDRQATASNIRQYLLKAEEEGLKEIGFTDHDMYWEYLKFDLIRQEALHFPDLRVRVGLEVDYREGQEETIKKLISQYDFDYIIGSVHEIRGWLFDMPEERENYYRKEPDDMYHSYFQLVEKAAASGLFNIIGHLDLIKIFKARPDSDVRELAHQTLNTIGQQGLAVEINTNGRYKPVEEFYPEIILIKEIQRRGIPFTLGSDAHEPGNTGRDLWEVCTLLKDLGVKEVIGFNKGQKEYYYL